jgi:hypothetical protein
MEKRNLLCDHFCVRKMTFVNCIKVLLAKEWSSFLPYGVIVRVGGYHDK